MPASPTLPTQSPLYTRPALLVAAGLGLAGVGLAAGLMLRSPAPSAAASGVDTAATTPTQASAQATAATPGAKARTGSVNNATTGRTAQSGTVTRSVEAARLATQPVAVCAHCGIVEGVRSVQHKGEGSGVGAVAGGVVGAVVGNQMGGGSGKAAMTVLGALGGGVAGNEIEKRSKTTTVYEVRVRMDDGTLRSFTSATAPTPGDAVKVTDNGYQVVQRPADGGVRTVRTAG